MEILKKRDEQSQEKIRKLHLEIEEYVLNENSSDRNEGKDDF